MLEIKNMSLSELESVLAWAAQEGWNPGIEDASAFLRSDPDGFLLGSVNGIPACAISVVKYDEHNAFLGLYLCQTEFRGQGHGWSIWNKGIETLGNRSIGLDGVVAQQENYRKSGFTLSHRNIRFTGEYDAAAEPDDCISIDAAQRADYIALDRCAAGLERQLYMQAWTAAVKTRISVGYVLNGELVAIGTIRQCLEGHKIGPLIAPDKGRAKKIISALCKRAEARNIYLDVPEPNTDAMALAAELGLEPVFETARMYRGAPPAARVNLSYGVATLELG